MIEVDNENGRIDHIPTYQVLIRALINPRSYCWMNVDGRVGYMVSL